MTWWWYCTVWVWWWGGSRDKVVGVVLRGQKREGFSRSQSPKGVKSRLALEDLSLQKTMMLTLE
jgi:hypothetical protein